MSQSTPTYFSAHERGPYYTGMLNAEATPFSPLVDFPSPGSQLSTLRPSAPVVVATTANVTMDPAAESATALIMDPTTESITEESDSPSHIHTVQDGGIYYNYYNEQVPLDDCVEAITSNYVPLELTSLNHYPLFSLDILTPVKSSPDETSDSSNDNMEQSMNKYEQLSLDTFLTQHADFFSAPIEHVDPSVTQGNKPDQANNNTGDESVANHGFDTDAAATTHTAFEPDASFIFQQPGIAILTHEILDHNGITHNSDSPHTTSTENFEHNPFYHTQIAMRSPAEQDLELHSVAKQLTNLSTTRTQHLVMDSPTIRYGDIRPYSPPPTPPKHQAQAFIVGDLGVPEHIDDEFDVDEASVPEPAKGNVRRNGKKTVKLNTARTAGVKKSKKKGIATAPSAALEAKAEVASLKTSIAEKMRKANIVINQQKKGATLAEKMGQHIQIIRESGRLKIKGVYWMAPGADDTLPSTEEGKQVLVQQLVAAMRKNKNCKEVEGSRQFENRWGDEAKYFSDEELEFAAWNAVDMMVDVHTNGWTSTIMDQNLRDQVQKTMFCTFEDRFGALAKLLTVSS